MSWNLNGKTAIITGGTKGIGLAISKEFLNLGANLIVIARDEAILDACLHQWHTEGYPVTGIAADIGNKKHHQKILQAVGEKTTSVDILVNNVGDNVPKSFVAYADTEYLNIFNVNLFGAIDMLRLFFPLLSKSSAASVINMASVAGITNVGTGAMYAMCKSAVIQLTKCLAVEWAPYHIRVNAVAPWFTGTDRINRLLQNEALKEYVINHTPLGRIASTEEIANTVAFLAMSRASYITGETIVVDGGFLANQGDVF
ncbi:MAG: SDR family oxidoreductase [Sediminibacterium sp.]|nr:SDR family oxidoreductase [Sediminibacterium sp.]MDP3127036.1 SDR family oxidoreductase [Sediminibacterium sp.]